MKPQPFPDRITLALSEIEDLKEDSAGWTWTMWAQLYGIVNDRLFRFHQGSFARTIRNRISRGGIKLHNGHNWGLDVCGTVGRILEAWDEPKGCRCRPFLSKAAPGPDIATKLADRTIDTCSVEIFRLKQERGEVAIGAIPEHVRPFAEMTTDGNALIWEIREVRWDALGLVSASSQDRPTMIEPPTLVSYQDLPVTSAALSGEARARLGAWANEGLADAALTSPCRLSRGFLVQLPGGDCLGQIGEPDEHDRLVVSGPALERAYAEIAEGLAGRLQPAALSLTLAGAARQIGRYEEKLRQHVGPTIPVGPTPSPAVEPAEPDTVSTTAAESCGSVSVDLSSASASVHESAASPDGPDPAPAPGPATHSAEGSNEAGDKLKKLAAKVKLLTLRKRAQRPKQGVRIHEPASASGGPAPSSPPE